jgi:tRNA 5-methylaminomethyl-2-thiouridine biosynthesis bifunctional protein
MKTAIVIGGGIAGCSTAFALAKRGVSVTLLERQSNIASGASGNPLAALYPKLGLSQTLADTLTMQGFAFTQQLLQSLPNTSYFYDFCGQIQLGFNAREQARQVALAELYALPLLSAEAASEQAGINLKVGGIYLPQAGWLKPIALCEALVQHPNITIQTYTEALQIEQVAQQWHVRSNHNALEADLLVLCNANEIQQFAQTRSVDITPVRGQLNTFQQTAESIAIKTLICSDHYLSPAVDGWHVVGTTYAPNDHDATIREADTRENMGALRTISSNIHESIDAKQMQGRVAWRSQTRDYVPLAGQMVDADKLRAKPPRYSAPPSTLPWLEGLYVNAGHGSKGMITAPLCAELIACLVTNSSLPVSAELAARLNPSRFLLRELGLKQMANTLYLHCEA